MRRRAPRAHLLAAALVWASLSRPGHAAPPAAAARAAPKRTVEFQIEGAGASIEVGVHPDVVTVVYLPEPITKVFASDQKRFELKPVGDSVAIRPKSADGSARGTLSVDTATLHVALVLKTTSFDDAFAQVFLKRKGEAPDARCQESLRALQAARTSGNASPTLAASLAQAASMRAAEGSTIARNASGVVLWVDRIVRTGGDVWLRLGVQNRGRAPFTIGRAEILVGGATFDLATVAWGKNELAFDEGTFGAVLLPKGADTVDRSSPVSLIVHDAQQTRDVRLAGVRLDLR